MRTLAAAAVLTLASILLPPPPLAAQPANLDTRILSYVPGRGLETGSGYDAVSMTAKTNPCITFDANDVKRFDVDPGNEDYSWHSVVTSSDHISNMFKVTYAESMDAGIFEGSANFAMANNVTYDVSHIRAVGFRRILQGDTKIIQNVVFKPEFAKLMKTDYEAFRGKCGDYYVAGYAFGGQYFGVIDIDKSALGVTVETEASMSEKMNGVFSSESMDVSMQDSFDRLSKHGALTVTEFSTGGTQTGATGVKSLKENYRNFASTLTAAPYKVKVILTPYTQLMTADSGTIVPNMVQMEDNAALYFEYQTLYNSLRNITRRPFQYTLKTAGGDSWSVAGIQKTMGEVSDSMNKIVNTLTTCSTATAPCPVERKLLKLPSSYTDALPIYVGSPQTCMDTKRHVTTPRDGMVTLFHQGDPNKPFNVQCLGMGTTNPREYLPLVYSGPPDSSGNGANYSQASLRPGWPVLVTTFTALRIDPQSLIVTPDDYTYSTSNGVFVEGPDLRQQPYATPFGCERHHPDWMHADIDLRGTPFAVAYVVNPDGTTPASRWTAVGSHAPEDGLGTIIPTDNNQKWSIGNPGGDCAWSQPGPLQLTYVGGYVPSQTLLRAAAKGMAARKIPPRGRAR